MTTANRITIFRLCMIPVFTVLIYFYTADRIWLRYVALGVYVFSALSDVLDGYIARKFNQQSRLGARLDPLADKLIVNLGFVFLAANPEFKNAIPMWFPVIVLARDIAIVMGAYIVNEYYGPVKVSPRVAGKLTTTLQMSTLIGVLLGVSFAGWLLNATVVMTAVSFIDYMYTGTRQALNRSASNGQEA